MATSMVAFAALHGEIFDFWLQQSKNAKPVSAQGGGQLSLLPCIPLLNKTCVQVVTKELNMGRKGNCHLVFSILVLLYSSERNMFSLA